MVEHTVYEWYLLYLYILDDKNIVMDALWAQEGGTYTHILIKGEDESYALAEDAASVHTMYSYAVRNGYTLYEHIGDPLIPYVLLTPQLIADINIVATDMANIMKCLYHSSKPLFLIQDNILCAPYVRIHSGMLSEVQDMFQSLCKYRGYEYTPGAINLMPLNGAMVAMNPTDEGIDMIDVPLKEPATILSMVLSQEPISAMVKRSKGDLKKDALVKSILMAGSERIKADQEKAIDLIPMISKDRSKDMSLFLSLGRCLYKIFGGDSHGLDLWRSACIDQMQDLCDEYWPTLETSCTFYKIHTLQYWASKDSPKEYKEWNSTNVRVALENSVLATGGILDVAMVAYRIDPTLFISDGDNTQEVTFFMWNGTFYAPCGNIAIKNYLDARIIPTYLDFLKEMNGIINRNEEQDSSFKEILKSKCGACTKIIIKLKSDSFQECLIKVLGRLYNKPGFDKIRDSNPYLTAFKDCIFDGERDHMGKVKSIREGIPEDYVTASTGYEFKQFWQEMEAMGTDAWEHPLIKLVLENLFKILYDPEKQSVMRREFASCLYAGNPLKRSIICQGPTNNGKSILYAWLAMALGSLFCPKVPNNLFYSKDAHPGNASPHFEMCRFARIVLQSEVDDTMVLNEPLFKRWTGCADEQTYRGLYCKKISSFVPASKPHTICNSFAKINGNSAALRTRILVITLLAKFIVKDGDEHESIKHLSDEEIQAYMKEHHWYWADLNFNKIMAETYKAFMWIMMQDYILWSRDGPEHVQQANIPMSIKRDTAQYFVRSNIYLQFMLSATKRSENAPGTSEYILYNAYKKWYADTIGRTGQASKDKFLEELSMLGYRSSNDIFHGLMVTYQ